jgi:hypothetical protein
MLLLSISQSKWHLNPYALLPSISHSFIRSPERMRLNRRLNFYEKSAALIAPSSHRLNKKPTR